VKLRSKFPTLIHQMIYRWRSPSARVRSGVGLAARDIVGPTGNMFSKGWELFEEGNAAYIKSFAPRVPHSLHISQIEQGRYGLAIPMSERCVEDWYEE
jgi:hypothetical protein